jgi:hypothetical protein
VSEQEIPSIIVRKERDGCRATIPALGEGAVFGPSSELRDVVIEAGQAVSRRLRAVMPGPTYPIPRLVVVAGTNLRTDDLLTLIEAHGGPYRLDLSGCYLARINLGRAALEVELAKRRAGGATDEPPWRSLLSDGMALSDAILHDTYLSNANLEGAELTGSDLSDAKLMGANLDNALLWHSDFRGAFVFDTGFRGADFLGAHLRGVDLYDAQLEGALWRGALLDRTRMRRERLGKATGEELVAKGQQAMSSLRPPPTFHEARETYLDLKTNFDSIGRYGDASWAYMKEQQMEKAMHFPTTAGHNWLRERMGSAVPPPWWGPGRLPRWLWWKLRSGFYHARLFLGLCPREVRQDMTRRDEQGEERDEWLSRRRWARNWAYELLTGYGERPWNPIIIAATCIAAFAVGYWATAAVRGFWDAVAYSVATFATFNLARPATQPQGLGVEFASAVEAMLGISLFALFVFTLGNRMRRS